MWKPAARIKYIATENEWPSAPVANASKLFSPIQLGSMTLKQRTWVPAMVPWRASEQGEVTDDVLQWYQRFAQGMPAVLVVEATGIRDIPSGPLLRIGDDRFIPGLTRLADTVRKASKGKTRLLIQLIDFLTIRRRPAPEKYLQRFLKIQDRHRAELSMSSESEQNIRARLITLTDEELQQVLSVKEWEDLSLGYRERVTDTHIPAIAELPYQLPDLFANAAVRAQAAGFDGVELHYAHAYTMASFLSAANNRSDGYGGDRQGRVRLPLEVFATVRQAVADNFIVGCRFLSDEIITTGSNLDDALYYARCFAEAGMDFLSLSRGGKFEDAKQPKVGWAAYPYTGRSGYECMPSYLSDEQGPFGRNITPVAAIRDGLRKQGHQTPCVLSGGIYSFRQAEAVLQQGQADIIGFARQALADPDWFEKVRTGYGSQAMICRYSNYCEGLDQKHKQVTCELWDRQQLDEPGITKSFDGKRRLLAPSWKPH